MTYTDPPALPVALYVQTDDRADRYSSPPGLRLMEIIARPLLLRPDGTPQNPDDNDTRGLADLRAAVTLYQDSAGPGWYELTYRSPFTVDRARADAMARTFRAIDAYERRDEARHGPPVDAAARILRLAGALRASTFLFDAPDRGPMGGTYAAADYLTLDAPTTAGRLRRLVDDWRAAHPRPTPAASAT